MQASHADITLVGFALILMTESVKVAKDEIEMLGPVQGPYGRIAQAIRHIHSEYKAWIELSERLESISETPRDDLRIALRACKDVRGAIDGDEQGQLAMLLREALASGRHSYMRINSTNGQPEPFWVSACRKLDKAFGTKRKWEPMRYKANAYLMGRNQDPPAAHA